MIEAGHFSTVLAAILVQQHNTSNHQTQTKEAKQEEEEEKWKAKMSKQFLIGANLMFWHGGFNSGPSQFFFM